MSLDDSKAAKVPAVASDGRLWVSRVLATIETLEKDTKHVKPLEETDEDDAALRVKAREIISRLKDVSAAFGAVPARRLIRTDHLIVGARRPARSRPWGRAPSRRDAAA